MQALLFEVTPREGHEDHYFEHAATLRPLLAQHDGLVFIERFKSLSRAHVILSHSLWRDEASIARWRSDQAHHKAQVAGRTRHFKDYRIRVSHVLQRFLPASGLSGLDQGGGYREPATQTDRFLLIRKTSALFTDGPGENFESVTERNSFLSVQELVSESAGQAELARAAANEKVLSVLLCRLSRDYGMLERSEAPQYYKPLVD